MPVDALGPVIQHPRRLVLLGVEELVLLAGLILEGDFVETVALVTVGAKHHARLVGGQIVGHGIGGIVDHAYDQRFVRIAIDKSHHHFHADARDNLRTPCTAAPCLTDPHPARIRAILLRLAIPREPQLDAAILVRMDFFAFRAGDDRHLRAFDARALRRPVWRQRHTSRDRFEVIAIFRLVAVCLIREINNAMACPDDHMFFIGMLWMGNLERRETAAGLQNARGRRTEYPVVVGLDRLGAQFLRPLRFFDCPDAGRVFVELALRRIRHLHQ
ncbi:hypothetical protein D3C87_1368170 [compost metagenome]